LDESGDRIKRSAGSGAILEHPERNGENDEDDEERDLASRFVL